MWRALNAFLTRLQGKRRRVGRAGAGQAWLHVTDCEITGGRRPTTAFGTYIVGTAVRGESRWAAARRRVEARGARAACGAAVERVGCAREAEDADLGGQDGVELRREVVFEPHPATDDLAAG